MLRFRKDTAATRFTSRDTCPLDPAVKPVPRRAGHPAMRVARPGVAPGLCLVLGRLTVFPPPEIGVRRSARSEIPSGDPIPDRSRAFPGRVLVPGLS